jgi:hypothetical protein
MKNSCLLITLLLCGCAVSPVPEPSSSELDGAESEGATCVGQIPAAVQGLEVASNGLPDKGGVCAAAAFAAVEPVQVYRVYRAGGSNPYGRWWSLNQPNGSREQYMATNAICPEWGALDRIISCRLKPGSQIVLGTTQSIQCEQTLYPQTADIQVYIPNDSQTQSIYVDDCTEEAIWQ